MAYWIGKQVQICLAIVLIFLFLPLLQAEECTGCRRSAVLKQCLNPHVPPGHHDQLKLFMDCMDRNMTNETVDEKDPGYQAAIAKCEHLAPINPGDIICPSSILSMLIPTCAGPCFSIGGAHPEYAFDVTLTSGPGGTETFLESGKSKTLKSSLTISLYYNGDQRIPVKTWQAKSSARSLHSVYNRMFRNKDALMKKDLPIHNLLWQFEQTPRTCRVLPEEISVSEEETREIILTGFQGQSGASKPFNRVVVKVDEGEIINGEALSSDPKARVFKVGNGIISLAYKSPDPCIKDEDTLYVYNSCDIAREAHIPLSETGIRNEIARKKIEILCDWEWTGEISFRRNCNVKRSGPVSGGQGKCNRKINADLNINCKLRTVYFNKTWKKIKHKGTITAPFTLTADFTNESIDNDGTKYIQRFSFPNHNETIKSSYDPVTKQSGGVTLNVYKESMTYEISLLISTKCMGTATIGGGSNVIEEPYEWSIKFIKNFKGGTDGKVISGSWKGPPCTFTSVMNCMTLWPSIPYIFSGDECGATWTWKLTRVK